MKLAGWLRRRGVPLRSVRVPTRLQFQETECGVAALAMVLAHHGQPVSLHALRQVTGVSRDCVNAADLAKAARHYGMTCRSYSREPGQLEDLPLPLLVHLRFIHFGVVEGFTRDEVLLNDPLCGPIRMPRAVFDEAFTGVVLVVQPQEEGAAASAPAARPRAGLEGAERSRAVLAVACGVLSAVLLAGTALALDGTLSFDWVLAASAATALLAVQHAGSDALAAGIARGWRARLVRHLRRVSGAFHAQRLPLRLAGALLACDEVGALTAGRIVRELPGAALCVAAVAGLALLHPAAAAWLATVLAVAVAAMGILWRLAGDARHGPAWPAAAAAPPMLATEAMERQQFAGGAHAVLAGSASALAANHAQRVASVHFEARLRAVAAGAGVLALGGVALLAAAVPARLPAAVALAVLAVLPVRGLPRSLFTRALLRRARAPLDDILATPASSEASGPAPQACAGCVLQARGLTFGFNPTRAPQVREVDLDLRPGEQLGLTGPSGGGKSTLAALLAGHHPPWQGTLALARGRDDAPVRVGWVSRAHFFIAASVRENLCLWGEVDDGVLARAVHDACLDDVLAARAGGLDAPVQLHGRNFSGGQRQRMEIARALLREPAVLVLDEAIDGLDAALEARLRERLRARGCALVIVSHRAGTLALCDRVLRVAGGRVAAPVQPVAAHADAAKPARTAPAGPPSVDVSAVRQPADAMAPAQLEACLSVIAQQCGVDGPAASLRGDDLHPHAIERAAARHGLLARRVRVLDPLHWERQALPLLAFRGGDAAPVLLRPGARAPRGLLPDAWSFMAAPPPVRTVGALLRACLQRNTRGLAAWAACAASATAATLLLPAWIASARVVPAFPAWTGLVLLAVGVGLAEALRQLAGQRVALGIEREALVAQAAREARLRIPALRALGAAGAGRGLHGLREWLRRARGWPLRAAQDAFTVAAGLAMTAWLLPALAPAAIAIAACIVPLGAGLARGERAQQGRRLRRAQASASLLHALLGGLDRLRSLGADGRALQHWLRQHEHGDATGRVAGRLAALAAAMPPLALALGGTALALGATPWRAAAAIALAAAWLPACARVAAGVATVATLRRPWRAAQALWCLPLALPADLPARAPALAAQDLHYRWPGAPATTLHGVTCAIAADEHVAITGPSGSGKSTLLRLLLGLDAPDAGAVRVDGVLPDDAGWAALRASTALVTQGERLDFSATLRAHLAGPAELSVAQVWAAVEAVGMAEAIHAMPMGLQTLSDGAHLSGGQEQLLLIARALLQRPRLLVLDEATNAIPDDAQARLLARLRTLGITCILVTHRASALQAMDRVLVLEGGRLAWSGAPAALRAAPERDAPWRNEQQEGHL